MGQGGGNVDTIHNVRTGVYATEDEQGRYASRGEYNSGPYHKHGNYKKTNAENSKKQDSGKAVDAYTGQTLSRNTKAQQDHLVSANSIHNDPAVWLAEANGADLANHKTNLHQTHHSINESKQQKSAEEYIAWLNKNRADRDSQIARLEEKAKNEPLSKKIRMHWRSTNSRTPSIRKNCASWMKWHASSMKAVFVGATTVVRNSVHIY